MQRRNTLILGALFAVALLALVLVACLPDVIESLPTPTPEEEGSRGIGGDVGIMAITCESYTSDDTPDGIPGTIDITDVITSGYLSTVTATVVISSTDLDGIYAIVYGDNGADLWIQEDIAGSGRITVTFSTNVTGNPISGDSYPYEGGPYSFATGFSTITIPDTWYLQTGYWGEDGGTVEDWDLEICSDSEEPTATPTPTNTPTVTPSPTTDPTQQCRDAFHVFRDRDQATATVSPAGCGNQAIPTIAPSYGLTWQDSSSGFGSSQLIGFLACGDLIYDGYIVDFTYSSYYQGSGTESCATPDPSIVQGFYDTGSPDVTPVSPYNVALFSCGQVSCGGGDYGAWRGDAGQPRTQRMILQAYPHFWESEIFGGSKDPACGVPGFLSGDVALSLIGCVPKGTGLTPQATLTPAGTNTPTPVLPLLTETPTWTPTPTATPTPTRTPTRTPRPTSTTAPTATPTARLWISEAYGANSAATPCVNWNNRGSCGDNDNFIEVSNGLLGARGYAGWTLTIGASCIYTFQADNMIGPLKVIYVDDMLSLDGYTCTTISADDTVVLKNAAGDTVETVAYTSIGGKSFGAANWRTPPAGRVWATGTPNPGTGG